VPFEETPREEDGRPLPHFEMIDAAFALARVYLQRKKRVRLGESVGIVVAHRVTEMECRARLREEQENAASYQSADDTFIPDDDLSFDKASDHMWPY
jgi:hypothetical protein